MQDLLIDDLPPLPELASFLRQDTSQGSEGGLPSGGPPSPSSQPVSAERSGIRHALMHAVTADDLRWHRAESIDACAGVTAPHNWCIMLPLSQRVQPGVYTLMALSRYRDALVRHAPPAEPWVYPPLIPEVLTSCFDVLVLPARPFRTDKPLTKDAFHMVSLFLQKRRAYPELCKNHDGPGALLLTPRLDAQTSFAKLFADLGTEEDVRRADLAALLAPGAPSPTQVTSSLFWPRLFFCAGDDPGGGLPSCGPPPAEPADSPEPEPMGGGAGPAVISPDDAPADEVPADDSQAPIDLVSETSESSDSASDSDHSSDVTIVEPVDQAAAVVPSAGDLLGRL